MRVSFQFMLADLPAPPGKPEVDVPDGSTLGQALSAYLKAHPIDDPHNKLPDSYFLIGKNPASLSSALSEGDEVKVMRILHGG